MNQIGTVTEAIEVVEMAKDAQWGVGISQRSGETNDSLIADLSVGQAAVQIKSGVPCRGERLAKYNQVNQIGTVTEAIEVVEMANDAQWGVGISQRSGETNDSFIAGLSVGLAAVQIKSGAPCRGEQLANYNQLIRMEEEFGDQARYVGDDRRQS